PGRALVRYLGYFVSSAPALLGFLWVILDSRHEAWHDKLAGTRVVSTLAVRVSTFYAPAATSAGRAPAPPAAAKVDGWIAEAIDLLEAFRGAEQLPGGGGRVRALDRKSGV